METKHLQLKGMSCASCANTIEQAIRTVPGVGECRVNFATEQATVQYNPQFTTPEVIQQAVADAGYAAQTIADNTPETEDAEKATREAEQRELTRKLVVGTVLSVLLVIAVLPNMTGLSLSWIPLWLSDPWMQLVLATPVQIWVGSTFFVGAWKAFKHHVANMDTLVALGTGVAYLYSLFVTAFPQVLLAEGIQPAVYYEVAAVVVTLILLGRLLENRAKGQTSEAIRKLMGLQAKTARVIRAGEEMDLPLAEVMVDDVIVVRPGEKFRWMVK